MGMLEIASSCAQASRGDTDLSFVVISQLEPRRANWLTRAAVPKNIPARHEDLYTPQGSHFEHSHKFRPCVKRKNWWYRKRAPSLSARFRGSFRATLWTLSPDVRSRSGRLGFCSPIGHTQARGIDDINGCPGNTVPSRRRQCVGRGRAPTQARPSRFQRRAYVRWLCSAGCRGVAR
jgi:hypothetical protein